MAAKETSELISSAFFRFMKVGSLFGKVGFSLAGEKMLSVFMGKESRERRIIENFMKNGDRIFEVLGQLKGGVMKIGQMISLQDGLLPPEIMQFLRMLQKEAPALPFEKMREQLEKEIPHYRDFVINIDEKPYASASIGQVHLVELRDGRRAAMKIQYPQIDKVIAADLKNLKILFKLLVNVLSKADFDPVWEEIEDRLLEEIDYRIELKNQKTFIEIFSGSKAVQVPFPVEELCSQRVMTSEFCPGDSLDAVVSQYSGDLKNQIGLHLIDIFLTQLFGNNLVHADPNAGNYAFQKNGSIILYDYGCVKYLPENVVTTYAFIVDEFYKKQYINIPEKLKSIELKMVDGRPVPTAIIQAYYELFHPIFLNQEYQFGQDEQLFEKLKAVGKKHFGDSLEIQIPKDIIFLHRAFEGLFGNLNRLKAEANFGLRVQTAVTPKL